MVVTTVEEEAALELVPETGATITVPLVAETGAMVTVVVESVQVVLLLDEPEMGAAVTVVVLVLVLLELEEEAEAEVGSATMAPEA